MGFSLRGIAQDIGRSFLKPLELGNSLRETVQNEVLNEAETVRDYIVNTT